MVPAGAANASAVVSTEMEVSPEPNADFEAEVETRDSVESIVEGADTANSVSSTDTDGEEGTAEPADCPLQAGLSNLMVIFVCS